MRLYEPIWERIKTAKSARIKAAPRHHSKIIKAVTKEKYSDVAYKLLLDERGEKAVLTHVCVNDDVLFTLKILPAFTVRAFK